jgi:phosphatidate cytidylyltransferase
MFKRLLTAAIGIPILIPFAVFSDKWPLIALFVFMGSVAVYETLKCTDMLKKIFIAVPSFAIMLEAVLLHLCVRTGYIDTDKYLSVMLLSYMVYFVTVMTAAVFSKGSIKLLNASQTALMIAYVSFGFSALVLLRDFSKSFGIVLFLLAFIVPWVCDGAAYFVGVFFGKHKLIPDVSPKKTVEGAIGGIVGGVVIAAIFGIVMHLGFGKVPNYFMLLCIALIGCLVSQWGDLIASLLKREYGIKDYGNLFPGHGGVMDRFDSLFSVAIFIYVICVICEGYGITLFVNW